MLAIGAYTCHNWELYAMWSWFKAFTTTALLEEHFPDLVDPSFTARMENTLDEISHGKVQWLPYLEGFYKGDEGLENQLFEPEPRSRFPKNYAFSNA